MMNKKKKRNVLLYAKYEMKLKMNVLILEKKM